jgi:hypothetical protein
MAQPIQEPTEGREIEGLAFRSRQLFRRPAVTPADVSARFVHYIPGPPPETNQRLDDVDDWIPLDLSGGSFGVNIDITYGGDAAVLSADGERIVLLNYEDNLTPAAEQLWHCGYYVYIGSWFSDDESNWTQWYATDPTVVYGHIMTTIGHGTSTSGPYTVEAPQSVTVPCDTATGDFNIDVDNPVVGFAFSASRLFNPGDLSTFFDPDPDTANGLAVQVRHTIDWVDDEAALKSAPAVLGGIVWGYRIAIGDA